MGSRLSCTDCLAKRNASTTFPPLSGDGNHASWLLQGRAGKPGVTLDALQSPGSSQLSTLKGVRSLRLAQEFSMVVFKGEEAQFCRSGIGT